MDQSLESLFTTSSPSHEQVLVTSSEKQGQLDDVIEGIERPSLEDNGAPSHTIPKWIMKTLKSLHPNEIRKTGTRSLTIKDDGGNANDSTQSDLNLGNNMESSFHYELN